MGEAALIKQLGCFVWLQVASCCSVLEKQQRVSYRWRCTAEDFKHMALQDQWEDWDRRVTQESRQRAWPPHSAQHQQNWTPCWRQGRGNTLLLSFSFSLFFEVVLFLSCFSFFLSIVLLFSLSFFLFLPFPQFFFLSVVLSPFSLNHPFPLSLFQSISDDPHFLKMCLYRKC